MIAGSWLIASVYTERMTQRSSTTLAVCGKSSLIQAARPAVPRELEDRAGQRQGRLVGRHARQPLTHPDRVRQVLAVHLVQERLVVEQVELRRPAAHEQVDDPLGPGRMMGRGKHPLGSAGSIAPGPSARHVPASTFAALGPARQQARQGRRSQPRAAASKRSAGG